MSKVRRSLTAIALTIFGLGIVSSGIFFIVQAGGDRDKSRSKRSNKVESQRKTEPAVKAAAATTGIVTPLINEVDSDQTGTDTGEFVEIVAAPNTSLAGYVLVFYNGSNDLSYASYDLDALTTDSNGFVILGNSAVPGVDVVFATNGLQNGQDAVALYLGDATSFPTNTPVTTANLVDALVYDTGQADDPGLLPLLGAGPAQVQVDENSFAGGFGVNSIQRCSDAARDGRAFVVRVPTANSRNACPQQPPVDMDGDGRTDFVVIRDSGGGFASEGLAVEPGGGAVTRRERRKLQRERYSKLQTSGLNSAAPSEDTSVWWIKSSATGATGGALWGDSNEADQFVSADFDGDGVDDLIYWRPDSDDSLSGFHWVNSSNFTIGFDAFGTFLDDPTVVGDYDGDGIDDRAVFRCPNSVPGPCAYFYRSSANPSPSFNYSGWGFGTIDDFYPCPGDYDGDRKIDLCVQREDPDDAGKAQFVLRRSSDGAAEYVGWGDFNSDFIVPGDYDGDGRSDFCVRRIDGDAYIHWILYRTGATTAIGWGQLNGFPPPDINVPGDYDGDGRTDIAIWRPADSVYWILQSGGGTRAEAWGIPSDSPLAQFSVR